MAGPVNASARARRAPAAPTPTEPAVLTIDLGALAANWLHLRDLVAPAECAAVVKADAYGIGLEPAVRVLWQSGCRTFFVAHLGEAERLKSVARDAVVYVLNGLLPGTAEAYVQAGARPILGSLEEASDWASVCERTGRRLPAAIHVETGMNRLGLPVEAAVALADDPLLARLEPALLMSHFVAAEDPAAAITGRQIEVFDRARAAFPGIPASLANSSGIFLADRPHYDLVRPGYALYGGNPTPGLPNPMRPVVRLEAAIVQVRDVGPGDTVGYNGRWSAPGAGRLAVLSVGYADGYPRAGGGTDRTAADGLDTSLALVDGITCPFVGRISMDLIVIDVTRVPSARAKRGEPAVLIGDALDLDEVGRRAGTIGYEILTGLGRRYARRYLPA